MSDVHDATEDYATPPGDEVFQAESPAPAVPVEFAGPQPVIGVGGRTTTIRTFSLAFGLAQRIADDDPRRTAITIIPVDQDIRLGHTQADGGSTGGTRLPVGVPLALTTSDEIWASCAVSGQTTEVSVFGELWAR